jgi:hypothetical protein
MPQPKNVYPSDCEAAVRGDRGPDCSHQELGATDKDRAREVVQRMGKHLRQQLEEIRQQCMRLDMKI